MNIVQFLRNSETSNGRNGATFPGQAIDPNNPSQMAQLMAREGTTGLSRTQYKEGVKLAENLLKRVFRGDRYAKVMLQEALTTSDFGVLFGDVIDRSVLANYAETPYSWSSYCKRATIQDFRLAKIFRIDRGSAVLDGPLIPNSYGATGSGPTGLEQVSEYPMRKRQATDYTDQLYKYGARMDFAWETLINDDLDGTPHRRGTRHEAVLHQHRAEYQLLQQRE